MKGKNKPLFTHKPIIAFLHDAGVFQAPALSVALIASSFFVPIANAQETELPSIHVQDTRVIDEPTGYQGRTTRVGKVPQDPHEIPQAVTIVTRQLMDEQQVGSLREALRNVSGLTFNAAEGGRSGDNMMLRGFYTFGDMYLDGIRDTAQYNRETFYLEQVDVLRGAAAMLFGRGQAGGVINQVSKSPYLTDEHKLSASIGTDNYRATTGDFNKRLGDTTALRVNVMYRDEGSWRSNPTTGTEPEIHRRGLHTSLGTGLGTNHEWVLSHLYLKTDDIPDYGFPFDTATRRPTTNFPVEYFWGIDRNFDTSDTHITFLSYTWHVAPRTQWRTQIRKADYERSYWARTPSATVTPGSTGLNLPSTNTGPTRASDYETVTVQSDFSTQGMLWGLKHEWLAGVEYLQEKSFRHSLQNLGGTSATNPPNFQPYVISITGNPVRFDGDSYAVYVQDAIEFVPRWKLTLGLRRDELSAQYSSATSPQLDYGEWSTRTALSFHPAGETHYYLAYSDSFSPTADLYQLTVTPQPPERSKVLELGAKWLLLEGDLALRAALYRAEKTWERNTDLETTAAILSKKRRTDGLELEMAGRVTQAWEVFAGLALMNAKILEVAENVNPNTGAITLAHPGFAGQRARNTPPYTFNLWTTYKLGGSWKVGAGIEAKGERFGYSPSSTTLPTLPGGTDFHPNTIPSYIRADALIAYEQRLYTVRLNVQNIFDKVYYDALYDNGGFAVPGQRRRFILTAELKFY